MNKAPCRGCPDRHPACHDRCEKYQAFHQEREEYLQHRWAESKGAREQTQRQKQRYRQGLWREKNGRH